MVLGINIRKELDNTLTSFDDAIIQPMSNDPLTLINPAMSFNLHAIEAGRDWLIDLVTPEVPEIPGGTLVTSYARTERWPVIYGTVKTAGLKVYETTTDEDGGEPNEWLHQVIVFSEGQIDSFEKIYFDKIPSDDPQFDGFFEIYPFTGSDYQHLPAALLALDDWTASHRLQGLAGLYCKFKWKGGEGKQPFSKQPNVTAVVKGKKVSPIGGGAKRYSDSVLECLWDYMTSSRYGWGFDPAWLQTAGWVQERTWADADVGGQKRMTCNLRLNTELSLKQNLDIFRHDYHLHLPPRLSEVRPVIEKDDSTVFDFNDDNMLGTVTYNAPSMESRLNRIVLRWADKDNDYEITEEVFPSAAIQSQLQAVDGGRVLEKTVTLNAINNRAEALQHGHVILYNSRDAYRLSFNIMGAALQLEAGDLVRVSHSPLQIIDQVFRVVAMDSHEQSIELRKHNPANYPWQGYAPSNPGGGTSYQDPYYQWPDDVSNIQLSVLPFTPVTADSSLSTFTLTCTPPAGVFSHAEVRYRMNLGTWITCPQQLTNSLSVHVPHFDGASYEIQVRSVSRYDRKGDWISGGAFQLNGGSALLSDITNLSADGGDAAGEFDGFDLHLNWKLSDQAKLYFSHYEVRLIDGQSETALTKIVTQPSAVFTFAEIQRTVASRSFLVGVTAVGVSGQRSVEAQLTVSNTEPSLHSGVRLHGTTDSITLRFDANTDQDYVKTRAWIFTGSGIAPALTNVASETTGNEIVFGGLQPATEYNVRYAVVDGYHRADELGVLSGEFSFTTAPDAVAETRAILELNRGGQLLDSARERMANITTAHEIFRTRVDDINMRARQDRIETTTAQANQLIDDLRTTANGIDAHQQEIDAQLALIDEKQQAAYAAIAELEAAVFDDIKDGSILEGFVGQVNDALEQLEGQVNQFQTAFDSELEQRATELQALTATSGLNAQLSAINASMSLVQSNIETGNVFAANRILLDVQNALTGAQASIDQVRAIQLSDSQATAEQLQLIESAFNGAAATLDEHIKTTASELAALTQKFQTLTATANDNRSEYLRNNTLRAEETAALNQQFEQLTATTQTTSATLSTLQQTVSDIEQASIDWLTQLQTQADNTSANLTTLQQTVSNNDESTASELQTMHATAGLGRELSALQTAFQYVTANSTNNEISAVKRETLALENSLTSARATIDLLRDVQITDALAMANSMATLNAQLGDAVSAINDIELAYATEIESLTSTTQQLTATLNSNRSEYLRNDTLRTEETRALAQTQTLLQANIRDAHAAIGGVLSVISDLEQSTAAFEQSVATEFEHNTSALLELNYSLSDLQQSTALYQQTTQSRFQENESMTLQLQQTFSDAEQANAITFNQLNSRIDYSNSTIQDLRQTLTTQTEALASQASQMRADFDQNSAVTNNSLSVLTDRQQSLSQYVSSIESSFNEQVAGVSQQVTTLSTQQSAQVNAFNSYTASNDLWATSVNEDITVLVNDTQSLAQRLTTLDGPNGSVSNLQVAVGSAASGSSPATGLYASINSVSTDVSDVRNSLIAATGWCSHGTHTDRATCEATTGHTWHTGSLAEAVTNVQIDDGAGNYTSAGALFSTLRSNGALNATASLYVNNGTLQGLFLSASEDASALNILVDDFKIKTGNGNVTPFSVANNTVTMSNVKVTSSIDIAGKFTVDAQGNFTATTGTLSAAINSAGGRFKVAAAAATNHSTPNGTQQAVSISDARTLEDTAGVIGLSEDTYGGYFYSNDGDGCRGISVNNDGVQGSTESASRGGGRFINTRGPQIILGTNLPAGASSPYRGSQFPAVVVGGLIATKFDLYFGQRDRYESSIRYWYALINRRVYSQGNPFPFADYGETSA